MIAVILAAGMASRLRPLTDNCPKCLLKIGERNLLQRTIDAVRSAGINELVVVTGYREEMIRSFLTEHYTDMRITFINNADYLTTNNIYSLWLAQPYVAGKEFMLLDSDILFDPAIITRLLDNKHTVLAVNTHKLGDEEMKVIVDNQNIITEISKTCDISKALGESVGIEKINSDYSLALFAELDTMINTEHLVDIFYERAFERLIPQGHKFMAVNTTDLFSIELDTVDDFNQACDIIPKELL